MRPQGRRWPWLAFLLVLAVASAAPLHQQPQQQEAQQGGSYVLTSLLGPVPGKEAFFSDFFQQKPTVLRRHNPTFYHPVMQPGEVDAVLVQSITATLLEDMGSKAAPSKNVTHPTPEEGNDEWKLVKRAKDAQGEWWSVSPAQGAKGKALLGLAADASDLDVAHAAFAHGFSLVVNHVENKADGAARLALAFEEELGYRTGINLYFTPDRSQGFEAHFDWMDAFVLQVDGSKRWRLYDAVVEQPRPDMRVKPSAAEVGEPFIDFVLDAGDLLYLPSGLIHEALTELEEEDDAGAGPTRKKGTGGPSLHLTLGLETTVLGSWESLLLEVLVVATEGTGESTNMSALACALSSGEPLGEVLSAVALHDKGLVVKVGDLVVLAVVQLAAQERALRRAVPLTPLMKQGMEGSSVLPAHLGELATLLLERGDVDAALASLIDQHKGALPRSLAACGNKGDGAQVEGRLAALAQSNQALPDAAKRSYAEAVQCVAGALRNVRQAETVLAHFEGKCLQDLQERQAERTTKLAQGVWQASIPAVDGMAEAPAQIYAVGAETSSI